ncbi:MAG: selenocysteine-specific translation elongation factor [Chloroflexi bacterium]|nr:selenocysteine-specific translation elongation factor [Chloroflexota bacterium]
MRVIGTAGHVDHGKSTLIEALTGTHPDRLKEEREREMTIDLGFAWWNLPNGEEIGVVDVPGHRDFIENMLAGVGGIDAVLFVVAADEGVMPQTREHLAILDILRVQDGVVALTKTDLVEDKDWIDLVEQDVREVLASTSLADAQIVRVSAAQGIGLDHLQTALEQVISKQAPRPDLGRPRLPVDRIFTMSGFGTVVTGTLTDGMLRVGEDVEILPAGLNGRIRGLQTHKRKEEVAVPGSRTAVNISGVAVDEIRRGDVVTRSGAFKPTRRLDVRFNLLADASQPLKHNSEVKFYISASEELARVRLMGVEVLEPGQTAWLQLELRNPVLAVRGDRYILRRPSPGETLGGGRVVEPHPSGRYKRFSEPVLARLETLAEGSPPEILLQAIIALRAAPLNEVIEKSNLESDVAAAAGDQLLAENQLLILETQTDHLEQDALVTSRSYWDAIKNHSLLEVEKYHKVQPLRRGIPREELKSRLDLAARVYNALMSKLIAENSLSESGPFISQPGHKIRFDGKQKEAIESLMSCFAANPHSPPTIKECVASVGEAVFMALVDLGDLVTVSSEVAFRREDYDLMIADVRNIIEKKGPISVAQARDHFNTTRRYVLAFLEHLDSEGVTVREGDTRRLK